MAKTTSFQVAMASGQWQKPPERENIFKFVCRSGPSRDALGHRMTLWASRDTLDALGHRAMSVSRFWPACDALAQLGHRVKLKACSAFVWLARILGSHPSPYVAEILGMIISPLGLMDKASDF